MARMSMDVTEAVTLAALMKAGASLFEMLKKAKDAKEVREALKGIERQIERVVQTQVEILKQLESMKVFISNEVRTQLIRLVESNIYTSRSQIGRIEQGIGARPNRELLAELAVEEKRITDTSYQLQSFGIAGLSGSTSSALLALAVYQLMRQLGAQSRSLNAQERSFLSVWEKNARDLLSGAGKNGFQTASEAIKNRRAALATEAAQLPRSFDAGWRNMGSVGDRGHICDRHERYVAEISGDLSVGFSARTLFAEYKLKDCYLWDPDRHPLISDKGEEIVLPRSYAEPVYEGYDIERPFTLTAALEEIATSQEKISDEDALLSVEYINDVQATVSRLNELGVEWRSLEQADRELSELEAYTSAWRSQINLRIAEIA